MEKSGSLEKYPRWFGAVALAVLLGACGGGGSGPASGGNGPPASMYAAKSGVAQKGPLIKGSTVTAQELDANLSPTGKQYSYQINSDLGTFSPTSTFSSQYIGLNATGYYIDEVGNAVSTGTVTLNGYSDLTAASVLNVNLLTTLAYQRIQHLVTTSNMTFAAAKTQAENEVLTALNIPAGSHGSFSTLDLGGGTDGDHFLAATSSIFVYGNSAGPLSQLIANFQSDIGANGVITNAATKSALASASKNVNPTVVAANLTQAYSSAGVVFTAANIADWIDQDGDGVVGKFKFQVSNATPSSVFTFPSSVVSVVAGTSVSVTGGQLSINGTQATGAVAVKAGDVITASPGVGAFPNGVLTSFLVSGATKVARISFVSGLLSVAVTPASPGVAKGLTQQFTATGTFSDTSTADLTRSVAWTSGTPSVATVARTTGLAQSIAVGSTIITATSGSVSGSGTLSVTPAILESLSITPNPVPSGVGIKTQLFAAGTYSDATTADLTNSVTWTSSAPSVATIGPTTGLVTGVALGATTIAVTNGSLSMNAPLTIGPPNAHSAPSPLTMVAGTGTLLPNGKVLAVGIGINSSGNIVRSADLYDPVKNEWSSAGGGTIYFDRHTATLLPNGKILVAGGAGSTGESIASVELYDPVTNTWSAAASLLTPRAGHTATLLPNGKVLVAGGEVLNIGLATNSAELYDPATNTWSAAASMATARYAHTATLLTNGKVLIAGGGSMGNAHLFASVELYDPATNTWSMAASLSTARGSPSATLLTNGKVLVAGGEEDFGYRQTIFSSTELYDPVANTWSAGASLLTARAALAATLMPNGMVLVTGGAASVELYDPTANTWSPAGTIVDQQITLFAATLLPNGMVLLIGQGSTPEAELYY